MSRQKEIKIIAKCVCCSEKREIKEGEVPQGEQPMCKCGCLMVAEKAEIK